MRAASVDIGIYAGKMFQQQSSAHVKDMRARDVILDPRPLAFCAAKPKGSGVKNGALLAASPAYRVIVSENLRFRFRNPH